jgi:ribose 5-phosphate isomerase B
MAERARSHNDANILVLGSKLVDDDISIKMVEKFLKTEFEGGRHARRIAKIR